MFLEQNCLTSRTYLFLRLKPVKNLSLRLKIKDHLADELSPAFFVENFVEFCNKMHLNNVLIKEK